MDGERLVYATAEGAMTRSWNIPTINTSVILLGQGASISQAAARKLAEERVLIAFVGTGATPIFMGSLSEYAPTEYLVRWIGFWNDPKARLRAAKSLALARCDAIELFWPQFQSAPSPEVVTYSYRQRIPDANSVEMLRGYEGDFAKSAYKEMARATRLEWNGRLAGKSDEQDLANRFLDQGNYLAYGLAGVVLWTLGIPPGLAVNHGVTRAGGLVFDLADAIKDAMVLPTAFEMAAHGARHQEFRDRLIEVFDQFNALQGLFEIFEKTIRAGTSDSQ